MFPSFCGDVMCEYMRLPLEETEQLNFLMSQETGEKRKTGKRAFKSEKELLEFTLKYQQVLAERDAGMLQ